MQFVWSYVQAGNSVNFAFEGLHALTALFIVKVHLAIKLVHRHSTFDNLKETIEINITG